MKSKIIFICMLLLISCSLSCVMAADVDNSTQDAGNVDFAAADIDEIVKDDYLAAADNDNLTASAGTFDELQGIVNNASAGSTVTLDRDYNGTSAKHVTISKSLTIDGNGHTIDCKKEKSCYAFGLTEGTITLKNLIIKNGQGGDFGGVIFISGSVKCIIDNCTFESNFAKSQGGAIFDGATDGTLTVTNSKFIDNKVNDWEGGAIYSKRDVIVENSYFKSNSADVDGGAIHSIRTVEATNCTFIANTATGASSHKCYGGAICAKMEIYLEKCVFLNNSADNSGGAIYGYNDVLVVDSTFDGNSAKEGGAIFGDGARVIVDRSIFRKNIAKNGSGGAIYSDKWAHAGNSTFSANTATGKGGAIYTNYIQFNGGTLFVNNSANGHGGAVYTDKIGKLVTGVDFENNQVTDNFGGAIYINKNSGDVYFTNCRFSKNHAHAGDGGAIFADSGSTDIHLQNCIFKDNYAEGGKETRFGGAIRICNKLYVYNSTFTGNWADKGGAIYASTIDYIRDSVFLSNHAKEGGAVYMNNKCTLTVERSYFEDNDARDGHGGAIYIDSKDSYLKLTSDSFVANNASDTGKDIYNCGYYVTWSNNWWGMNDPTFDQRVVEHHGTGSDGNVKDDHPVKINLTGQSEGYTFNKIPFTVTFSNAVANYTYEKIAITSDKNANITGREVSKNSLKFNLVTNESGVHKITVKLNSQTLTYNVTVLRSTIIGTDLVMYYQDELTYSAVFLDGKGNPLVEGSPVTFQIGDEKYIAYVSENGVATLDVNLEPGVYTVKAINKVTDSVLTNVITVKERTLVYNINDTFIMKFVGDDSLDNTTVTFKIAGKTYEANITKGIAYLLLDFAPGTYKFDIIYGDQVLTCNLTILNRYSVVDMDFAGSFSYGTLLPIYANESFTSVENTIYSYLGNDTYRYIMPDNTAFILYNATASNSAELTNVLKRISQPSFQADVIIINLKPTTYTVKDNFWRDQEWYYLIHLTHGKLFINGNGAVIDDGYHHNFLASNAGTSVVISNLTLKKFYRCFLNNGEVYCKDSYFVHNDPKFWATTTPGGVIHNKNEATFENCVFDHNENGKEIDKHKEATWGGVLYADEKSVNTFIKCSFKSSDDTIRALKDSIVVIYDDSYETYSFLKRISYFDIDSCMDLRGMSTLNTNRTKTLNFHNVTEFSKFVQDDVINDVNCDASNFVINLDNNKTYNLTEDNIDKIADSSRQWRSIFLHTSSTPIHVRYYLDMGSKPIVINGHGSTISLTGGDVGHDYSFAYIPYKGSLTLVNLTLSGFNTAIINRGTLIIINCTFKKNVIHYFNLDGDDGGAIRNFAKVYCYNSTFEKNGAVQGGAYYSSGTSAEGVFYNCTFTGNIYKSKSALKEGDPNAFYVDGSSVVKLVKCNVKNSDIKKDNGGLLFYRENINNSVYTGLIDSVAGLYKLSKMVSNNDKYDVFNVTLAKGDYDVFPDSTTLFDMKYGTLILNGNGARIFVQSPSDNDETHFANLSAISSLYMNGLTIEGFNIAIINKGNLEIYNSMFYKNKVEYKSKDDYGGAIVNQKMLMAFNTSFVGNYAKYGGAVYNKGVSKFIGCSYLDNVGYENHAKVDIYTFQASVESVVLNGTAPIVVEKFPMPAWQADLRATAFKLLITAVSAGVSYGVAMLEISTGFLISEAVSTLIGGGFGAIHGLLYSIDHQDYSKFWSKVFEGARMGLDGASIGSAMFRIIDVPTVDPPIPKQIMNKILHKLFTKTTEYGKSFVDTYQRDKSYKNIGIYMFFKSMRS